jgi:hypothetical protein
VRTLISVVIAVFLAAVAVPSYAESPASQPAGEKVVKSKKVKKAALKKGKRHHKRFAKAKKVKRNHARKSTKKHRAVKKAKAHKAQKAQKAAAETAE